LDRVEAWPVELRNSTSWSSRWSSWSLRWFPPSSLAYPVEQLDRPSFNSIELGVKEPNFKKQQFKMLRGEGSKAAFTKREITRGARRMLKTLTKEDEEEIERLREERRTKRRNDPISSESELGEFEIG
ncbi:unnamed protein product, partial [Microthlaspi erraticum]